MRDWIQRKLVLPAFETLWHQRDNFKYFAELEKTQWLPRARLENLQLEALHKLLTHAYENCPYYRDAWSRLGLAPSDLRSLVDLHRWPVIDRDTITAHRMEMRAVRPKMELISKATGGSSGVPLRFDYDANSEQRRYAAYYRGYSWAGADPGNRQLWLWGVPLGAQSRWKRFKERAYQAIYRRRVLNCFELSEDRVPGFLRRLNRYRPDVIVAYTGALYTFARQLEQRGLVPHAPRSIVVGAEKLHGFQRDLIQRVFRAPVFETYGSREFMLIGAECDRHEGLHLTAEHLTVEVVDDDGLPAAPGEEGDVVITDLYNYGMPFVRYRNGDRAIAGFALCSCGRGLPLLRKVVGRQIDVIGTPDGRSVPGEFFPHLMKDFGAVRRFVVVQEAPDRLEIRVVPSSGWAAADRETILSRTRQAVGPSMRVELNEVDDIPLTAAGKQRVVINRCGARAPQHEACAAAAMLP